MNLAEQLREAFEEVYERWMQEVGDAHDAWDVDDLIKAALRVIEEPKPGGDDG